MAVISSGQRRRGQMRPRTVLTYLFLALVMLFVLIPALWIVAQSFMVEGQIYKWPIRFIPDPPTLAHYRSLFVPSQDVPDLPIARWLFNSAFVALVTTAIVLLIASLAAYPFARMAFPGRDWLFMALGFSMLIPGQLTFIPTFLIVRAFGWIDTYHALIWPPVAGFFAVFFLRQFFQGIPTELEDAAIIDGCSQLGVFQHVILPLSTPALATIAIFTFLGMWNEFFWPLVVLNSNEMRTLPIGLTIFQGGYWSLQGPVMAGAVFASAPVVLVYILLQRYITKAVILSGFGGR